MKNIAIIAAVAASLAAPAFAQSASTVAAIQHFNLSAERTSDIVSIPSGQNSQRVSTAGGGALATAFGVFNDSATSLSDLRGVNGATVVSGTPAAGADIFERLRAASLEDE